MSEAPGVSEQLRAIAEQNPDWAAAGRPMLTEQQSAAFEDADCYVPPREVLDSECYLISRGVRPLALIGHCPADPVTMCRVKTLLHRAVTASHVITFVIGEGDKGHGPSAAFGYAAHRWVIDMLRWALSERVPPVRRHEILGLLCGYSPAAIARHQESDGLWSYQTQRDVREPAARGQAAARRGGERGVSGRPSPQWAFMQGYQVTKDGRPFLDRLRVVQTPWFSVLLHRIHGPDPDRDPHDHPWWFASLILSGSYDELLWDHPEDIGKPAARDAVGWARKRHHGRFSLMPVKLSQAHQITKVNGVLWTLVLAGRRHGSWRFWTPAGPVDWHDYLKAGKDSDADPW